ncbi:MAG: DUF6286 domain-containing protein [Actinomycetota bacterium]|nr:DUF6286 domain-containing protein [Actinomycetota bacterium]
MRTVDRLIATVLALAFIAAGLLTVVEIVFAALGLRPWVVPYESWLVTARSSAYGDRPVLTVSTLLLALGLVLVLLQLLRRRPLSLPLLPKYDGVEPRIERKSLEQAASRAAREVDGVEKADCRATSGRMVVNATSGREETVGLDGKIRAAVEERLTALEPAQALKVAVKLRNPSRS